MCRPRSTCRTTRWWCVVAAGDAAGRPIDGIAEAESLDGVTVFHARTALDDSGAVVTGGSGRILGVTGRGATLAEARERAYAGIARIRFDGMQYRSDIAERAARQ